MSDPIKKVLSVRRFKAGYEIREEVINGKEYGGKDFTMKVAYTAEGYYIGDTKWAYRLWNRWGIKPELAFPSNNVCSIGYSKKKGKWYGWSHRAIYGFRTGSKVKIGDCGFRPSNQKEFLDALKAWYSDDMYKNLELTPLKSGVRIRYGSKDVSYNSIDKYPKEWGHGKWRAKSMDDAKQMAIDFADGVS